MQRSIFASFVVSFLLPASISSVFGSALIGCGNKAEPPPRPRDDAAAEPLAAPLAMPALGVDRITRFNFPYEAGAAAHDKAVAAHRKKDWAAVRTHAESSLAKDPMHLGSHRLLAAALVQTGEPAAAVDHLVTAIAADYLQYAPTLADDDLASFWASPHGEPVKALAAQIGDEYPKRIASGLVLVGRRAPFKWPRDPGVQTSTSRGELYAFDRASRRYLRLTHTGHQVAGFVRAPSGSEVAIVGFNRIDRARPETKPAAKPETAEAAPVFARAWIRAYETAAWQPITPQIPLPRAREVAIGYGAGDQLLVAAAQATGRWTVGAPVSSSVDRTTGKLTKVATALAAPRVVVSLDEGHLVRIPDGVVAAWAGEPPVTSRLQTAAGTPIQIPESGVASQPSIAVSPGGAYVAFATAADPCAKDTAPSLYVADARTGTYKHLLSANSRFPTRWLDATVLAYEDGEGAIRLWDATTGREALRLENKAGIALDVLSLAAAPLCKQAPPSIDEAAPGDDPLPPEDTGDPESGPVTAPQ